MPRSIRLVCNRVCYLLAAGLFLAPFPAAFAMAGPAGPTATGANELTGLSLEELGTIVVTSVSKKPEQLIDAPASIFVITRDDIRRSGATTLPEALQMAPNLEVARTSNGQWVISARGFNSTTGNKMLVLIDGRSVYTPLFSGVFWDTKDVILADIERIEVISGPGGTLWGVNAVNGVINVITRSAKNTQGGMISGGAGNSEHIASARYGGTLGDGDSDSVSYRLFAKTLDQRNSELGDGNPVNDGWHFSHAGFRMDWEHSGNSVSLQGNAYNGAEAQPAPGEISVSGVNIPLGQVLTSGANLSANWTHQLTGGASVSVLSYFDRTERNAIPVFDDKEDIYDIQVLHALAPIGAHAITLGAEYRRGDDVINNSPYIAFLPSSLNQKWNSAFVQDQWALRNDLQLTLGARVERNSYTGNEFLPNARIAWHPDANSMLWSAYSRTVREPSRLDHDTFIPGAPPYLLDGGPDVVSEVARVLELGYRANPAANMSYSVTLYHALYDHLLIEQVNAAETAVVFANGMRGSTTGIEAWGNYLVTKTWRLSVGMSALREYVAFYEPSPLTFSVYSPGQDPAISWQLRSSFDLPQQTELDLTLRHVSALSNPDVPAYTVLGGRIGWSPLRNLELSMTVQNLIGSGHAEFGPMATRTELGRTVYFKAVARF